MENSKIEKVVCYHHNDLDGRSAAAMVKYFLNISKKDSEHFIATVKNIDYFSSGATHADMIFEECDHVKPINTSIAKDKLVFIVDYSFGEKELKYIKEIMSLASKVIMIDHHITSIDMEEKYPELEELDGIRDTSMSGVALVFNYFTGYIFYDMPLFVKYISDYDTWKYEFGSSTKFFKKGMDCLDQRPEASIWKVFMDEYLDKHEKTSLDKITEIIVIGKYINDYDENRYKEYFEYAYETIVDNNKTAIVINSVEHTSFVFGDAMKSYDYGIIWNRTNTGAYLYSVYSDNYEEKGTDCEAICKRYGGGGHKGAAGFVSDKLIW